MNKKLEALLHVGAMAVVVTLAVATLLGSPVAGKGNPPAARQGDAIYPAKSVHLVQTQATVKGGQSHLKAIRQRLITASGEWKETTVAFGNDGPLAPSHMYSNKTGQYAVGRKAESLSVVGEGAPSREVFRSTKFLRNHREFVGEGSLLDYKTFIWRAEMTPGSYIEQHFAPELSDLPIKIVKHTPDFETVIEPVSIEFIEVTPEMIATPDLPISTAHLKQVADNLEKSGQKDAASRVRAFAATKEQSK